MVKKHYTYFGGTFLLSLLCLRLVTLIEGQTNTDAISPVADFNSFACAETPVSQSFSSTSCLGLEDACRQAETAVELKFVALCAEFSCGMSVATDANSTDLLANETAADLNVLNSTTSTCRLSVGQTRCQRSTFQADTNACDGSGIGYYCSLACDARCECGPRFEIVSVEDQIEEMPVMEPTVVPSPVVTPAPDTDATPFILEIFGLSHRALGDASFAVGPSRQLQVYNIGSSGADGVEINAPGNINSLDITMVPFLTSPPNTETGVKRQSSNSSSGSGGIEFIPTGRINNESGQAFWGLFFNAKNDMWQVSLVPMGLSFGRVVVNVIRDDELVVTFNASVPLQLENDTTLRQRVLAIIPTTQWIVNPFFSTDGTTIVYIEFETSTRVQLLFEDEEQTPQAVETAPTTQAPQPSTQEGTAVPSPPTSQPQQSQTTPPQTVETTSPTPQQQTARQEQTPTQQITEPSQPTTEPSQQTSETVVVDRIEIVVVDYIPAIETTIDDIQIVAANIEGFEILDESNPHLPESPAAAMSPQPETPQSSTVPPAQTTMAPVPATSASPATSPPTSQEASAPPSQTTVSPGNTSV